MSKKSPRSPPRSPKANTEDKPPNTEEDCSDILAQGYKFLNGDGVPVNLKEASRLFKAASDKGNAEGMLLYGRMLRSGDGVIMNKKKGEDLIKKSADSLNFDAMCEYGQICEEKGDVGSMLSAQIYYVKSTGDKKPEHCYRCAQLFQKNSRGNDNSAEQAMNYFKIAADQGYNPAILSYGLMMKKINKKESAKYFKIGAENNDPKCMFHYASALSNGEGIPQNKVEAANYFKSAADNGVPEAMLAYGLALENGDGVNANKKEAVNYFKLAADNGQTEALVCYAIHLANGDVDGLPSDKKKALDLFQKAADDGNVKGMHHFADLVLSDGVCPNRKDDALSYLKRAVDNEYPPSLVLYSSLLLNKNDNDGASYLKKAADLGDENAKKIYEDFLKNGKATNLLPRTSVDEKIKETSNNKTTNTQNIQSSQTTSRNTNNNTTNGSSKCCIIE